MRSSGSSARKRLGEFTFCRIRLSNDGVIAGWLPEGFYDPEAAVGGALSDLGCHPVYLTQLFLGALPATVSATYASFTRRQVEDQAVVTLGYPGGAIGVVETGFPSRDPFTIEMHGTMASLAYDSTENLLRVRSAGEDTSGSRSRCLKTMLTRSAGGCRTSATAREPMTT